ncbi:MAG: DUF559 domain-containing protein [Clostridia bacterium]|nr:DUF559 domain-containing protein [Clostridia bacterium]
MGRNGTSLREQSLFYFIHKFFPDTINRYKTRYSGKTLELDIFITSLKLVIEYDGGHWHENKADADNKKNKMINEMGYKVLRVREYGLPHLASFDGDVIDLPYEGVNNRGYDYINFTLDYLANLVNEPFQSELKSFRVDESLYNQEAKYIYALRYPDVVERNISTMCGIKYWDKTRNFPLVPTHIQKYEWVPAILVCKNNREIPLPRYHRNYKSECRVQCNLCFCGIMCPLIPWCKRDNTNLIHCEFVEKRFWKMINQKKRITKVDLFTKYQYSIAFQNG